MKLIYVTGLTNKKTNEKVFVMIDIETGRKYLSISKDKFIPYLGDDELLDELNNDKEFYKNNSVMKKVLAIQGVLNTVTLSVVGIAIIKELSRSNIDYVLKREVPGYTVSDEVDYGDLDSFSNEFARNISINEDYTDKEDFVIENGANDFLADWGYLYSEKDKKDLLFGIRSFKINREANLESPVVGTYYNGNIKIKDGHHNILTTTHEVIHGMLKHTSNMRRTLLFGFERAIDEAVTATINKHYFEKYVGYEKEEAYKYPREVLYRISLLFDNNEDIMKTQMLHDGDLFNLVCKTCPHVSRLDIIRFFSILDLTVKPKANDKYTIDDYEQEIDKIYSEMYEDRYGKKLPDDIVFLNEDFLDDYVEFYTMSYPCVYKMPRELFRRIKDFDNIDPYYISSYIATNPAPMLLLCTEEERNEFYKDNECFDYLYEKYSDNKEDLKKLMSCFILNDEDFKPYFELYIDCLKERNLSQEEFVSELGKGLDTFFMSCIRSDGSKLSDDSFVEDSYREKHYEELETIIKEGGLSSDNVLSFYLNFGYNLRLSNLEKEEVIGTKK